MYTPLSSFRLSVYPKQNASLLSNKELFNLLLNAFIQIRSIVYQYIFEYTCFFFSPTDNFYPFSSRKLLRYTGRFCYIL